MPLTRDTHPAFAESNQPSKRQRSLPLVLLDEPFPPEFQTEFEEHARVVWRSDNLSAEVLDEVVGVVSYQHTAVDAQLLATLPNLKVISNFGAGYDHIDVAAATQRGLHVGNTPGVVADATADLAIGLIISARRNIVSGHQRVLGAVTFDPNWFGCEVTGSVLGIVGMGAIGKQLAMRAKGFRMHCLYWSRTRQSEQIERELHLKWCDTLDELLGHSDTVVLAVTCGTETFDMISEPQLKAMKSSSLLVNVARGKVVNTDALVRALQQVCCLNVGAE